MQPTLIHLLIMIAIGVLIMMSAQFGYQLFGYPGGAVGGILGVVLGFYFGVAFSRFLNFLMERGVRRKSTAILRAELIDGYTPGTYVSGLIISVLLERGDPVDSFRDHILRQLHSNDVTWRKSGLNNLEICYPAVASKLKGFDVFHPTEEDLQRLKEIETAFKNIHSSDIE